MANRTFISFDWAIKKILRHKENFDVLEGFLSELLGFDVFIQNLLESEGNKQAENDKFDRVDILVQTRSRELMLIEIQYDGMERAKSVLRYEMMAENDKLAYRRHIENRRIESSVIETAEDKAIRRKSIQFAIKLLSAGSALPFVAEMSELTLQEVTLLSQGKELDKEEEED